MKQGIIMLLGVLSASVLCSQTWTGNTNSDWNTGSNWNGGVIPTAAGNVTIPPIPAGGRFPVLASAVTINTLSMATGAELDFGGNTLTTSSLDVRGIFKNTGSDSAIRIAITGTAASYVRNAIFKDSVTFKLQGTGNFFDSYTDGGNIYEKDVTYLRSNDGSSYISYYKRNNYLGNIVLLCSAITVLDFGFAGADVSGNFDLQSAGGNVNIGRNTSLTPTHIGGTLKINVQPNGSFALNRVINLTPGGSIVALNRSAIEMNNDSVRINEINIQGYSGTFSLSSCLVEGDLLFSSALANTGNTYVMQNKITGNASFTIAGNHNFYDTYVSQVKNEYAGNVSYTKSSASGTMYICRYDSNVYGGNVTISGTVPTTLDLFYKGANISGDLQVQSAGGDLLLGNTAEKSTRIAGKLNITASTGGNFVMNHLINLTSGGSVVANDRSVITVRNDSIRVNELTINNASNTVDVSRNQIEGHFNLSNISSAASQVFVRANLVAGNTFYQHRGSGTFFDTYIGSVSTGNTYNGNVSYTRTGTGPIYIGYYDSVNIGGNLLFDVNAGSPAETRYLRFVGSTPSVISQSGNLPLLFSRLSLNKSGGAGIVLLDSMRINERLYFQNGNIFASAGREIIFLGNALALGGNDSSKVVGPVVKVGPEAFTFPVGTATNMQAVTMTAPGSTGSRFRVKYLQQSPHPSYDTSQRDAGLAMMDASQYWQVVREAGTANVALTFDYGLPGPCVEFPQNLRVAYWNDSLWQNLGNGGTTGGKDTGRVTTAAVVIKYGIFGLGTSATVSPLVSIAASVPNPVCLCRKVAFTATPSLAGCTPGYQWRKNNVIAGTNSATYADSTLAEGDIITCTIQGSAAFTVEPYHQSNAITINTTEINTWTGTTSSNWHVADNWSCMSVPCGSTQVIIAGGTPFPAEIQEKDVHVKSLQVSPSAAFRVLNARRITIQQ